MVIGPNDEFHLSYCTNIHPGESWSEVYENMTTYLPTLKRRLAPDDSFGVGLRLSSQAAEELAAGDRLSELASWLEEQGLYVYTINGFPYGSFHHEVVKDCVYAPDWRRDERVNYTVRLARILARLVPEGLEGGISTSPVSYKPWMDPDDWEDTFETAARNLAEVTAALVELRQETGRLIHIDIEPEPNCLLENTRETVDFFTEWVDPVGREYLAGTLDITPEAAADRLREHIRVCYDTCHFAVEYEEPAETFAAFKQAGIRIGKIQISSALKVSIPDSSKGRARLRERLRPFSEAVYLHQVIERRSGGEFYCYPDLDVALIHGGDETAEEWRIHYHVPIFVEQFDGLASTQGHIARTLDLVRRDPSCSHLEIETYTWDVLPEELKQDIVSSIEREYEWVLAYV
jgi:sugar phosphate isomerase/epimerase